MNLEYVQMDEDNVDTQFSKCRHHLNWTQIRIYLQNKTDSDYSIYWLRMDILYFERYSIKFGGGEGDEIQNSISWNEQPFVFAAE